VIPLIAKKSKEHCLSVVMQLVPLQQFDAKTRTKTVQSLVAQLDQSGIERYLVYLFNSFRAPPKARDQPRDDEHDDDDEDDAASSPMTFVERQQVWVLNQLLALTRNHSLQRRDSWLKQILHFVLYHTFFTAAERKQTRSSGSSKKSKSPPHQWVYTLQTTNGPDPQPIVLSAAVRKVCQERLLAILAELGAHAATMNSADSASGGAKRSLVGMELVLPRPATIHTFYWSWWRWRWRWGGAIRSTSYTVLWLISYL